MSDFLNSLTQKAQSAINASPLAGHIPGYSGAQQGQQSPPQGSFGRSHTLEALQYQFRSIQQQYSATSPLQKIITTAKGVAIDYDSVSKDAKAQSKEVYSWGQGEGDDIKDVSDRLAYLNFVHGNLAGALALKLDAARAPLKGLRDAEAALAPRRNARVGLQAQIARLEHEHARGMEKRIEELKAQLEKAEEADESAENDIQLQKRTALGGSERAKWEAILEYGEKLVLLAQAATPIISAIPPSVPTPSEPYTGTEKTAATRAALQHALDNYKPGDTILSLTSPGADLSRSDTRSFGESHAGELSNMSDSVTATTVPGIPLTPPEQSSDLPNVSTQPASPPVTAKSPPLNPQALNNNPAPIPTPQASTSAAAPPLAPVAAPDPADLSVKEPAATPTVAETGVPLLAAESGGPGPASGSLRNLKAASPTAGPRSGGLPGNTPHLSPYGQNQSSDLPTTGDSSTSSTAVKYESAEEEKKRLQREERERVLAGAASPSPAATSSGHETAEAEKKRLQLEERERILLGEDGASDHPRKDDDEELPPYQPI